MDSQALQTSTALIDPLSIKPDYTCRFPYHDHEHGNEIIANVRSVLLQKWPFRSVKQREAYAAINIEHWGTMLAYDAPKDRAEIYTLWESYFALLDDVLENLPTVECQKMGSRLIEIMSSSDILADMNDMERLLYDICFKIRGAYSEGVTGFDELTKRFLEETCQHVRYATARDKRSESLNHGLNEYLEYRIVDIGGWCSVLGQLWSRGIVVPPHMTDDKDLYSLQELSLFHAIIVNDLFSYRKEKRQFDQSRSSSPDGGFTLYNSIVIFQNFYGMSASETIEGLKKQITMYEDAFLATLEGLKVKYAGSNQDLDVVERVGLAMMDLMKGNAHWSSYTSRYN